MVAFASPFSHLALCRSGLFLFVSLVLILVWVLLLFVANYHPLGVVHPADVVVGPPAHSSVLQSMFRSLLTALAAAAVLAPAAAQNGDFQLDQRALRPRGGPRGGGGRGGGRGQRGNNARQFPQDTTLLEACAGRVDTSYTLESWSKPNLIPVIVLTRGRSGSTVFSDALEIMMNGYVDTQYPITMEFADAYVQRSQIYFNKICSKHANNSYSDEEVLNPLIPLPTPTNSHAKLFGFKWKMLAEFTYPRMWNAFKNDGGKVIVLERNYLDWLISNAKHQTASVTASHCQDEECAEAMKNVHICLNAPHVVGGIATLDKQWDVFHEALEEAGVDYLRMWHKDLFYSENRTEYWTQILHFLGRTDAKVTESILLKAENGFLTTSSMNQRATLANYDAVQKALQGSGFEHFLRSNDEPTPPGADVACTASNTH